MELENHEVAIINERRVGSRKSQLALIQTNEIIRLLKEKDPSKRYKILSMATIGDKILETALSKIGEKSLFTKELELGLMDNSFEFIVHSLKDLPTILPDGMVIAAVTERLCPTDVIVMHKKHAHLKLHELPFGSVIGTSSVRRSAQLKRNFPHLTYEDVRGNLNTRLSKLDNGNVYDALILAAAGITRMGWEDRISQYLTKEECFYAVGQGALGIECRQDDLNTIQYLSELTDEVTTLCCIAERAYLRELEGGCSAPVGIYSNIVDNQLELVGGVFSLDGSESIIKSASTKLSDAFIPIEHEKLQVFCGIVSPLISPLNMAAAENIGTRLAEDMLKEGASRILREAKAVTQEINTNPHKPPLVL